jgi:hypothetical protein
MASAPGVTFSSTGREGTTKEHRDFEILDDKFRYSHGDGSVETTRVALLADIPLIAEQRPGNTNTSTA